MVHTPRYMSDRMPEPRRGRRWLGVALAVTLVAGGALYLALTNDTATKGYEVSRLEQELASKRMEVQKLEAKAAEIKASLGPALAPEDVQFVAVDKIEYLAATPLPGVAVK